MRGYRFPVTALALSGLAILSLGVRPATASPANVELLSVTQEGSFFRFNYDLALAQNESVVAGDFFTIIDFAGLVPGSTTAPAGFTSSSSLVGPTAQNVSPMDNAGIPNITFTSTGATQIGGRISGFSALSQFGSITSGTFTAETTDAGGPVRGNISSIGPAAVPQVPEAGTLALLGVGLALGGIATARRRRSN